jgi:hypothetical protein
LRRGKEHGPWRERAEVGDGEAELLQISRGYTCGLPCGE